MRASFTYKKRLIRGDSFQLPQSNSWIPRFTLTRDDGDRELGRSFTHHDRLDKVFWTKNEADEFALKDAMQWIDQN